MNTDNDYDNDGNNIVPCPICLSVYCPSKEGGKCPEEDEYIKSMQAPHTEQKGWREEFRSSFVTTRGTNHPPYDMLYLIESFIERTLQEQREEIRQEYIPAIIEALIPNDGKLYAMIECPDKGARFYYQVLIKDTPP